MNKSSLELLSLSNDKRLEYLQMVSGTREALIPSSFSIIDIITYLYYQNLILQDSSIVDIIISKGHAASVLYPFISEKEKVDINYCCDGSSFGIYSNIEIPHIHMPSGSLGHGLGVAIGLTDVQRDVYKDRNLFVVLGDGECFEGSIWEALMYISNSENSSIIPIIDYNNRTILGNLSELYSRYNLITKLKGFGFNVFEFDGHDFAQIDSAVKESINSRTPSCLVASTIKGKGIKYMESSHLWHNRMPNEELFKQAIMGLGGKYE